MRTFSRWRLAGLVLFLVLLSIAFPGWLRMLKLLMYTPVGWVVLWLLLINGYFWLYPRPNNR